MIDFKFYSIYNYGNVLYESIEDIVADRLENYKKKVIPGTDEYDLIFEKLYEEELSKRGMI